MEGATSWKCWYFCRWRYLLLYFSLHLSSFSLILLDDQFLNSYYFTWKRENVKFNLIGTLPLCWNSFCLISNHNFNAFLFSAFLCKNMSFLWNTEMSLDLVIMNLWRPWKSERSCCVELEIQNAKTQKWIYKASLLHVQIGQTSPYQFHLLLILRRLSSFLRKEANAAWSSPSLSPTTSFLVSNTLILFGKLGLEVS